MSDQPGTENFDTDLGSMSLDDDIDAGSGQPGLLDATEGDNLPGSPPDEKPVNTEWGTTIAEQRERETIEQRIAQELPDPDTAYGAPENESGLEEPELVGGDDPDAIPAELDFLGEPRDDLDAASLTTPDEGIRPDTEGTLIAEEGVDFRSGAPEDESAEESAMRIVEE